VRELDARLRRAMDTMRVADVHSHLGGIRQAQTLADIASYHWLSVELTRAKGSPIEANPRRDPEGYLREVVPLFPAIRNTVNHYAFVGILRDLYGFQDRTLTKANWQAADEGVRAHADDPAWLAAVLDRAGIERILVAINDGMPDDTPRYVPYDYGEPVYATRSLEPFERWAALGISVPTTPNELVAAIETRLEWLAAGKGARALHVWAPGTWNYRPVQPSEVAPIITRLNADQPVSEADRDTLASFCSDVAAAGAGRRDMVIQLFHGAIKYTPKGYCAAYYNPEFLRSRALHFERHPETTFDVFLATRAASQEAVFLSRACRNVMVSGGWWMGFSPTTLGTFFRDRLELLPNTAWNAFYSDGYIVEWCYGKLLVTKNRLARALGELVEDDFISEDDALDIAQSVLYNNAVAAYGL